MPLTLQLRRARIPSGADVMVRRGKCIGPSLPRRVAAARIAHLPSARKSVPRGGDFALGLGFVGLIFLVFPASLGLSDRIEDHVSVFRVGAADSEARQHVWHVAIRTPAYGRCTDLFRVFILTEAATLMICDDRGSCACRCCGRVSPHA